MSDISQYYPEHHLMHIRVYGVLTAESLEDTIRIMTERVMHIDTPFHMLLDLREVEQFPPLLAQLRIEMPPPPGNTNLMWIVILIDGSPLRQFYVWLASRLFVKHPRRRIFKTLEEGIAHLQRVDPTLNLEPLIPELQKPL